MSLLAAQRLAPCPQGPLLIVGAGVQGKAHLEAFAKGLAITEVMIASRSAASAQALARHAQSLGLQARVATNADAALADCPLVVTCTPASQVVLSARPRSDAFMAAVGAFSPQMMELGPALCRHVAEQGTLVVDTADARHEPGDLLQAGLNRRCFSVTFGDIAAPVAAGIGATVPRDCLVTEAYLAAFGKNSRSPPVL